MQTSQDNAFLFDRDYDKEAYESKNNVVKINNSPFLPTTPSTLSHNTYSRSVNSQDYNLSPLSANNPFDTLYLNPAPDNLPEILKSAVTIIPNKFYWLSTSTKIAKCKNVYFFGTDSEFIYEPFSEDFGPFDLAITYRYCQRLIEIFQNPSFECFRIVHVVTSEASKRANGAYLVAAFCVIILGWSPEKSVEPFLKLNPPLMPYRDATNGECHYKLTLMHCCEALHKAITLGWFNFNNFDIDTYEYYQKPENGDINWIIPNEFLAFSSPESNNYINSMTHNSPENYVSKFHKLGVNLVIRLNRRHYDKNVFTANGIDHVDLYLPDGSCPSTNIVNSFLNLVENHSGAIAVHCRAGLGRTGTLIGCYAIKHYGFTGPIWIAWNRISRPGSILGPQQQFLCNIEKQLRCQNTMIAHHRNFGSTLENMSQEQKIIANEGDVGQGVRLLQNKFHTIIHDTMKDANNDSMNPDTLNLMFKLEPKIYSDLVVQNTQ